jgi:maltose phosphorylase
MAGTWMSIVEGFGGMRVKNDTLSFEPRIPKQWDGYSFKVNFRNQILKVNVTQGNTKFELNGTDEMKIVVNNKEIMIKPNNLVTV